jgi:Ras-related GTP-binding protein A/B
MSKKKMLLMGKSGAGKTSMRSIIFANYVAKDTMKLGYTLDIEHVNIRFLGNLTLNLWDCGGQYRFFESYFENDTMFRNVEVLIYVFDVDSMDLANDLLFFSNVMATLERCSPDASVFVLVHKMDLVPEDDREQTFFDREAIIQSKTAHFKIKSFATSIWDETLYKAWSNIVYSMIPNVDQLESQLKEFCDICGADEVVLFEKATFLEISHTTTLSSEQYDSHRFERISNIVKQFKISCFKTNSQFQGMEVRNSHFIAYIDAFTENTYIMVVMTGATEPKTSTTVIQMNISAARKHFEKFIPENS